MKFPKLFSFLNNTASVNEKNIVTNLCSNESSINDSKILVKPNSRRKCHCPNCGMLIRRDILGFNDAQGRIESKYKCRCNHTSLIAIERRHFERKKKRLYGNIIETDEEGYQVHKSIKSKIVIKNISIGGIRICLRKEMPVKEEDQIEIEFILDGPEKIVIVRKVKIRQICSPSDIGCQFLSNDHYGHLREFFSAWV